MLHKLKSTSRSECVHERASERDRWRLTDRFFFYTHKNSDLRQKPSFTMRPSYNFNTKARDIEKNFLMKAKAYYCCTIFFFTQNATDTQYIAATQNKSGGKNINLAT